MISEGIAARILMALFVVIIISLPIEAQTDTGCYLLESYNHPDYFIRHANFLAELATINTTSDKQASTFALVPSLADNSDGYVSFDSLNYPGHYLKNQDFRLELDCLMPDQQFREDTSFEMVHGLADESEVSFESYNHPGYYIRNRDFHLYLEQNDRSQLFKEDATFRMKDLARVKVKEKGLAQSPEGDAITSKVIFNNWNVGGVDNSPSSATSFTISEPYMITYIDTYHWNDGSGTEAGGTVALRDDDGKEYGPWQVETKSGQGGVPNAWWIAHPNEKIPAGTYKIIDSDQSTWSQNSESDGRGFSKVEGYPIKDNSASEGQTDIGSGSIGNVPETDGKSISGQSNVDAGLSDTASDTTIDTAPGTICNPNAKTKNPIKIGKVAGEPEAAASANNQGKVSGTPAPIKIGNTRSAGKEVGTAANNPNYFAGWLSNKDVKLTGDFMGLGHDQLLIINRDPAGTTDGKIEVIDLSENSVISKYFESYGDQDQLKGWIDDEDLQLAGDFMGLGHDQVMFISRTSTPDKTSPYFGNEWKLMIADFSKGQPPAKILCQLSSDKANYLAGWLSDKDVKLTGDFMGLGHDQLLIINRDPVGATDGKIMILDFSKGSPENEYQENYELGKSKDPWLDNEDIQLAGDFMGLGHDQVMFISRTSIPDKTSPYFGNEWKLMIADFSKGQHPAEILFQAGEKANYLAGWLSDKDVKLTGDFMGLGHDQLLIINRDPVGATDGKTAIFDFAENSIAIKYFELYGSSDLLNGWIDDEDIQLAGDFTNLGYSQVMFISRSPVGDKSSPYLGNNWKLMIADFSKGQPPTMVAHQESSP